MLSLIIAATVTTVELETSSSPCETKTCKKIEQLAIPGLGKVELDRILPADPFGPSLVVRVRTGSETHWLMLATEGDNCGTVTCVVRKPKSVHLVRLDPKGEPTFGIELESTLEVTFNFKDVGKPYSLPESYRLVCVGRAGAIDCKQATFGGRNDHCRALGWKGTAVRYECTDEAPLAVPRRADTESLSQTEVERLQQLELDVRIAIGSNQSDCPELVKQLDKLFARDQDAFAIAKRHLPAWLRSEFWRDLDPLTGAHTCFEHEPTQRALERTFLAMGIPASFALPAKP